ncbi:hypothetical protein TEA_022990 [Camellia sinensis var. sinensis]|uniref:Cleavage and polyadenylation specificity factor subunit 5 n=1 Tax=Camellia sinensis var. sinensis TaxID=542762 RepID=A0A4S4EAB1_CAMSN|nr:hypothetical protein TEA_022990 [Camellia sinensis var. sinensis]
MRTCVEAVILTYCSGEDRDTDTELRLNMFLQRNSKEPCLANTTLLKWIVELFKHPHLLLLQVRNSVFKLPGGRLRPGESEVDCLKRKLSSKLSEGSVLEWEVGECLGMWWRPDFETLMFPYLPPNVKKPKECTKLFLVKLPESRKFIVPRNFKLLAVPLCQIHENHKVQKLHLECKLIEQFTVHGDWIGPFCFTLSSEDIRADYIRSSAIAFKILLQHHRILKQATSSELIAFKLNLLKLEVLWLPPRPWELIASESGISHGFEATISDHCRSFFRALIPRFHHISSSSSFALILCHHCTPTVFTALSRPRFVGLDVFEQEQGLLAAHEDEGRS